jgi:ribosomal protein S18 acetylase RimI-like enzyme
MILKALKEDSLQIATLHRQTISEGFLSKLGEDFLESLYSYLIQKELVLGYKEYHHILGYVSCAISSKGIMKRFVFSSPDGIIKLIEALLKNPGLTKPLLETFRAPGLSDPESGEEIPETELLSISVSSQAQQGGIGTQLLSELEQELRNRNIFKYKVIAGEKLIGANQFYLKNGFVLVKQICIHGNDNSNVYVKEIK